MRRKHWTHTHTSKHKAGVGLVCECQLRDAGWFTCESNFTGNSTFVWRPLSSILTEPILCARRSIPNGDGGKKKGGRKALWTSGCGGFCTVITGWVSYKEVQLEVWEFSWQKRSPAKWFPRSYPPVSVNSQTGRDFSITWHRQGWFYVNTSWDRKKNGKPSTFSFFFHTAVKWSSSLTGGALRPHTHMDARPRTDASRGGSVLRNTQHMAELHAVFSWHALHRRLSDGTLRAAV